MNNGLDTDLKLDRLVRAVDPMLDPRVQADCGMDAESALRQVAATIDHAPARMRARRRSLPLRIAALALVVAAAVFVVTNVSLTGNGSSVSPAQAQVILAHVRAALRWPPGAIYEEDAITTVTAPDDTTNTSEFHEWLSTSAPYDSREIVIANGNIQWEQAYVNSNSESSLDLYDPVTNTVYLAPPSAQLPLCAASESSANPCQVLDEPQSNSALSEVQDLLTQATPNVTIDADTTLDGKSAIELTFDNGRFNYWLSARTYQPLQVQDRQDSLPDGQAGVGITRYPIARLRTGSAAAPDLLSLRAQHPSASVDNSSTDYLAALSRAGIERPGVNTPAVPLAETPGGDGDWGALDNHW
jgi:hypothetical protein